MSAIDMCGPLVDNLKQLENGIVVYDAVTQQNIFVMCPVICALYDNVRAAELVNHLGSRTFMFCRICMVSIMIMYLVLVQFIE